MSIRVLLADDAKVMLKALRSLLESQPEIEIVGEAADFTQTIRMTKELKPHVVVMDLHMPEEAGIGPLDIRSHFAQNGPRLVAISIWNDDQTKALADSCGANRFLDKAKLGSELLPVIKELAPIA